MNAPSITKIATALCAAAIALVGLAAPAQAGEWKGTDPGHDVAAKVCKPRCTYHPAPGNSSADMVKQRVTYGFNTIRITVTLRGLDRSTSFALTNVLAATDRKGRYFAAISAFSPTRPAKVSLKNPSGVPLKCGAATTWTAGNKIHTVLPSRCLNTPDWVRWSGYVRVIFPGDLDNDRRYSGWFDKFRASSSTPLNKNSLKFSRRVFRAA